MTTRKTKVAGTLTPAVVNATDAAAYIGVSRATLYQIAEDSSFPRSIQISPGRVGWLIAELDDYIARLAARRSSEAA